MKEISKYNSQELNNIIVEHNIISEEDLKNRIILLLQKEYNDGVLSTFDKCETPVQLTNSFNNNLSDAYLEYNFKFLLQVLLEMIKNNMMGDKMKINWEESLTEEVRNFIKVIYDTGFLNGINISQDKNKLNIYLKNKDKIESGN